jgi:hypothetical protein
MAEQPPTAIPSTQEQNESPTYGTGVWISYKKDLRTRLRSSLHSVARFLRIMSQPSHDIFEEFRDLKADFSTVKSYYNFLSTFYKSPETWLLDRNRWKITKISTYKSTGFFKHEYLVAEVKCEEETVYLRIERRRSKSRASKASDDSDPSSTEDDLPTGGGSSGSSSKTAHDTITFAKALKTIVNDKECVEVIQFSEGKGLSLSQITVLALCVNSMGRIYSLLKANCYWFAHLVVKAAMLIEPASDVKLVSKTRPGEWLNLLPITKSDSEVIQEVKAAYDKLWKTFNEDVSGICCLLFA